jgi:hypothetical protein
VEPAIAGGRGHGCIQHPENICEKLHGFRLPSFGGIIS